MSLQNRFRLLVGIFGVSVVANVLVSVWCIHLHVGEATRRFELLMFSLRNTDQVRRLVDEVVADLQQRPFREVQDTRYRSLCLQVAQGVKELPAVDQDHSGRSQGERLRELSARLTRSAERYVELVDVARLADAGEVLADEILVQCAQPMQQLLAGLALEDNRALSQTSAAVGDKEATVTAILTLNAAAAFLLAFAGVHLVRNWVLKPVAALKAAAEQHASGNLGYRIDPIASDDELGALSRDVNRMADSLTDIQHRLLEQERLAAIGEVTSTVAHNIRNPLAGIRASAQASMADLPDDSEIRTRLATMVNTVDSLSRWLRELLQVSQPIELNCRPTSVADLVTRVCGVLQTSAERRRVKIVFERSGRNDVALIDAPRVEQAVLTVVANALEASPPEQEVSIEVGPAGQTGRIELQVADRGPGIQAAVLERIASPYFSTKPGGTGIGLYLAKRVIRAHGGSLEFQNAPDRGTRVTVRLPAVNEATQGA